MTPPIETSSAEASPPNMYLLGLELEDVRCFEGAHILDLSDGHGAPARWTLILGENGVGKTTLLELLEGLRPISLEQSSAALLQRTRSENVFYTFGRSNKAWWTFKIKVKQAASLSIPSASQPVEFVGHVDANGSSSSVHTPDVAVTTYGYGASRRVGLGTASSSSLMKDASIVLSDAENLQNPERWFLDAALSAKHPSPHQERAQAQLTKIESVLTRVLPDVTEVRVGIVDRAGEITPCLQVHGPDGWVPYSALGVGYRTTMAWMVDLAIRLFNRYPTLPDPLSGGGVCLVDEIDLHLHPRWQRTLMATLSEIFPNVQFIATAHSPLMVQSANTANVVVLRRRDGRVVIDNDPPNVQKWRVDQILTSDLFGLPSARAPELDAAIGRRNTLLSKPTLTADDEAELAELSNVIGAVPYGDTPEDIEAANTIRLAAKSLAGRR